MHNLDVLLFTYLQKTHQVKDYTPKYTKKKKKKNPQNSTVRKQMTQLKKSAKGFLQIHHQRRYTDG